MELVLVLAGLAEGVMVGIERGAPQVYGAAEYVAGGGVYLPRLFGGEGICPAGRVNAGGEEDPALEDNREEAENLLEQVGNDYERAEQAYAEARNLADENPNLIESTS